MKIRTRIAPSPTGYMHVGTARTALFNYLFAKQNHGEFLLRIEDTDTERSKKEFETDIVNSLKWLGLNWDEELIRQSERVSIHKEYLAKLIENKKAFYCFHTIEELEEEQKNQALEKISFKHECEHKDLSLDKALEKLKKENAIIRLKTPHKKITFKDLIRGEVEFDTNLLGDISLAKNLDTPLYNLAVVVDDHETQITHVIRGEDHLPNTPKQILIQEALEFKQPEYAHLPLILSADRSKLSKRHGAVSVNEFARLGYLPKAMLNFMTLIGWHPKDDKEIFNLEELVKEFDLERVQKAGGIFNIEKLKSINNQYIKELVPAEIAKFIAPYLDMYNPTEAQLIKVAHLFKDRLNTFSEIKDLASFVFALPTYEIKLLSWKDAPKEKIKTNLQIVLSILENISEDSFDIDTTTTELMPKANNIGRGDLLWPLRVALSGMAKSPSPFEILDVLGKKESINRIKKALEKLNES
ncbi:MAG: glutamate--tRNA ligase [bacterium]|nr:glutamate--tRNA ligase [bacterium]